MTEEKRYIFEAYIEKDQNTNHEVLGELIQDTTGTVGRDGLSIRQSLLEAQKILDQQGWMSLGRYVTEDGKQIIRYKTNVVPPYRW